MGKETFRNVWLLWVVVSKEFSVTKVYSSEPSAAQTNGLATDTSSPTTWKLPGRGVWLGLGAGVLLTLVGTRILGGAGSPSTEAPPPPAVSSTTAQTVTATPAQMAAVTDTLTVNGTVQAVDLLEVTPQIGGLQIRQMLVRDGDSVAAGQAIATLDTPPWKQTFARSRPSLPWPRPR
jgi:hypothetical protein